jgi:hypothetical protein
MNPRTKYGIETSHPSTIQKEIPIYFGVRFLKVKFASSHAYDA